MSIVSQPAPEGVHVVVCDCLAVLHRQRPAHVLVEDVEHLQTVIIAIIQSRRVNIQTRRVPDLVLGDEGREDAAVCAADAVALPGLVLAVLHLRVLGVLGALLPPGVHPRPVVVADDGPQIRGVPLPRQDADLLVSSVVLA